MLFSAELHKSAIYIHTEYTHTHNIVYILEYAYTPS